MENKVSANTEHHVSHKKEYFIIFIVLTVLTAIEIAVAEIKGISYAFKASSLVFLAVGKAFIVAWSYMHLKGESAWLKFIAAIPISAGLYALVVILESVYR